MKIGRPPDGLLAVAHLEFVDPAAGVHDLVLAGVEGVRLAGDFRSRVADQAPHAAWSSKRLQILHMPHKMPW